MDQILTVVMEVGCVMHSKYISAELPLIYQVDCTVSNMLISLHVFFDNFHVDFNFNFFSLEIRQFLLYFSVFFDNFPFDFFFLWKSGITYRVARLCHSNRFLQQIFSEKIFTVCELLKESFSVPHRLSCTKKKFSFS